MDLCLLNNDIPFDVLSRLPADKLIELRSVSKQWQHLLADPDFKRFQMQIAKPISISGYFFQERFEYSDIDVEKLSYIPLGAKETKIYQNVLDFLPEKVTILASSNGLICCRSCTPSVSPAIYICNPVNKEWMTLPWDDVHRRDYIAFSFEPTVASSFNAAASYKIVRVYELDSFIEEKEEFVFAFDTYDWERRKWVKSKEVCHCDDYLCRNKRILVKGILYWLTERCQVLTFDLENELSFLISIPQAFIESSCPEVCLGESNAELHCLVVSQEALQVWVLVDRFSSKWDLKYFISFEVMQQENPHLPCNLVDRVSSAVCDKSAWIHLLAFKDGHLFLRISNAAYSLDIHTRKMRFLCSMFDLGHQVILGPTAVPYSISLAPVAVT